MHLVCLQKNLHKNCFQFLLGVTIVTKESENTACVFLFFVVVVVFLGWGWWGGGGDDKQVNYE